MRAFKKKQKEFYEYLKKNITDNMGLAEMVDVFECMCQIPSGLEAEDDFILFETGPYGCNPSAFDNPFFIFHLSRQIPNGDEEYYLVELTVNYAPTDENRLFTNNMWSDEIEGDFFALVRASKAFNTLNDADILNRHVVQDET